MRMKAWQRNHHVEYFLRCCLLFSASAERTKSRRRLKARQKETAIRFVCRSHVLHGGTVDGIGSVGGDGNSSRKRKRERDWFAKKIDAVSVRAWTVDRVVYGDKNTRIKFHQNETFRSFPPPTSLPLCLFLFFAWMRAALKNSKLCSTSSRRIALLLVKNETLNGKSQR